MRSQRASDKPQARPSRTELRTVKRREGLHQSCGGGVRIIRKKLTKS